MKIEIEIKANEKSCGKCRFYMNFRGGNCSLFNKSLETLGQGRKRLDECKDAEVKNGQSIRKF